MNDSTADVRSSDVTDAITTEPSPTVHTWSTQPKTLEREFRDMIAHDQARQDMLRGFAIVAMATLDAEQYSSRTELD